MIAFLTGLTVAYAIILILVLAVSLIAIAATLWRIGSSLAQIAQGVGLVERQTAPLAGHMAALNDGLAAVRATLHSATGHLAATDAQLAGVLGEPAELRVVSDVA
ncbi:MAG: hypothetical protein HY691_04255 [Chloroflexi bacterium]|nr:hypothetical protein [Chloroflexota bacterium]